MNQTLKTGLRAAIVASGFLLAGCGNDVKESLGLARTAPDEFTVVSRPALSVPPEFTLRPPRPGEAPRTTSMEDQAHGLLIGKTPSSVTQDPRQLVQPTVDTAVTPVIATSQPTGAEASFLKRAGADNAQEDIRAKLGEDVLQKPQAENARSLLEQVQGKSTDEPTVDAKKEAERLRSNKDEGKPATEGDVPNEKVKPPTLLDRIF